MTTNPANILQHGQKAWIGNYEVRNFHGFYQSREGGKGPWQFHVSGFDDTVTGQAGTCTVILAKGGVESIPIDATDRITINGRKYGRANWKH